MGLNHVKTRQIKILFILAGLLMAAAPPQLPTVPTSGKSLQAFVPTGWHILSFTEGDIDADKDADIVLAMASDAEDDPASKGGLPRLLVFLLKEKGGYKLAASSDKAILCKTCGSSKDDPFRAPTIEGGDVVIRHETTGAKRLATKHQFHYQDGNWYLIGKQASTQPASSKKTTSLEMNLVEGKQTRQTTNDTGKKISDYINFQPKPLSKVTSFNIGQEWNSVDNWGTGS